jgi:Bacteriophage tail tube protein
MATRKLPSRITDINLFVDGYGLLGTVESITLPAVKTKKENQNSQHVDTGVLEPMEAEVELNIMNEIIYKEMAKLKDAKLKAKGSYQEDGTKKPAVATLAGPMDIDPDAWKSGDVMKTKVKMYVNVYNLQLDGTEVIDVDIPNYIAKIGGEDIYEKVRAHLS